MQLFLPLFSYFRPLFLTDKIRCDREINLYANSFRLHLTIISCYRTHIVPSTFLVSTAAQSSKEGLGDVGIENTIQMMTII